MKKFTLLVLSLLTVTYAMADRIPTTRAKQNVISFLGLDNAPEGKSTCSKQDTPEIQKVYESEGYYVFAGKANNGFVIAAADDQMVSEVLGYTDEGNFDASNMPDGMKELLQTYDNEAQWLAQHPEAKRKAMKTSRPAIAPLIKTHWAQRPFYNDQCPMYGTNHCVTGCVITATAQVMNFHKWPETGRGTNIYMWKGTQQLSRDFSKSTYDWNSMTNVIDSTSTQKSKDAVAKLMSDVGIALCANYGASTGAREDSIAYALPTFFKYSRDAYVAYRTYYTTDEWEQLAYESLQRKEPICYGGVGSDGHEFVCDGYKDGYFHINWGWSSGKDGYFLLTTLDPDGIASAGDSNPYVARQTMILNLRPDKADTTKVVPHFLNDYDFTLFYDEKLDLYTTLADYFTLQYNCTNVQFGLEFVDSEGKSEFHFNKESKQYKYNELVKNVGYPKSVFPTKDGVYKVYPVVYGVDSKTYTRIHTKAIRAAFTTVTIKNGQIDINNNTFPDKIIICKNVEHGKFYAGKYTQVKATLVNTSKTHYAGEVTYAISGGSLKYDLYTNSFADLEPGDSTTIILTVQAPTDPTQTYKLKVQDAGSSNIYTTDIKVNAVPTGKFVANLTAEPKITIDENDNVTVLVDYACTSGFCDAFYVTFYDFNTDKNIGSIDIQMPMGVGDSGRMTFNRHLDFLEPNTEYKFDISGKLEDYIDIKYGSQVLFQFKTSGTTDIETVEEVVNNNDDDTIYDLQGRKVLNPIHGQIYIIHGKKVLK